jgi:hypothetical protein
VNDEPTDSPPATQFHYHLELTPAQLKITYTALHSLLDDFGHEEHDVLRVIHDVLGKLPDEHAIRAIQLDSEINEKIEDKLPDDSDDSPDDSGTPSAA